MSAAAAVSALWIRTPPVWQPDLPAKACPCSCRFCLAAAVVATVLLPFMAADKPAEARKGLRVTVGSSSYVPPSPRRRFPYSSADTVAATIAYDLRPEAVRARWHTQIDDLYKSLGIVKPERVDELLDTIWAGKEHELFDLIEIKYKLHKKTYGSDPDSEPDSPGEEDEVGRSFDAHAAGRSFGGMARGAEESGPRTMGKYLVVAMTLVFLVLVYDARLTIADNGLQLYLVRPRLPHRAAPHWKPAGFALQRGAAD